MTSKGHKGKKLRPVTEKFRHGEGKIERLSQCSENSQIRRRQDLRSEGRRNTFNITILGSFLTQSYAAEAEFEPLILHLPSTRMRCTLRWSYLETLQHIPGQIDHYHVTPLHNLKGKQQEAILNDRVWGHPTRAYPHCTVDNPSVVYIGKMFGKPWHAHAESLAPKGMI